MRHSVNILFLLCLSLCLHAQNKKSISLNGSWKLYYGLCDKNAPVTPDELKSKNWPMIAATVPGNVELDLLSSGIIKNPEVGNHIYDLRKYEAYQWWYSCEFETPVLSEGEQTEIVFDGLDCFGTLWINNRLIGQTSNMFISHRFDVTQFLNSKGKNTLFVRIDPAVKEGQKMIQGVVGSRMDNAAEFVSVRKAPSMYGWGHHAPPG